MRWLDGDERTKDAVLGYTLLRMLVGLNILMHGVARIMSGAANFANGLVNQFQSTPLADNAVHAFGTVLPSLEAVLGSLLLLGLWTRWTVLASAMLLAVLTYGSCLVQDWESVGLQLIYAIVYALLLILRHWNLLSLDGWMHSRREAPVAAEPDHPLD